MNRSFNDNEFDRSIHIGNKRMAIVSVIWCLIIIPIIFFVSNNYLGFFIILWLIWTIIGVLVSPKISKKIWK